MTDVYQSSSGPKTIAGMNYHNLRAAHAKLMRDEPERAAEIEAMGVRLAEMDALHAAATADGSNMPPEPVEDIQAARQPPLARDEPSAPDTMAGIKAHFDDLYVETGNWADGVDIATEAQAFEVDRLIDAWKAAIKTAETVRDAEIKPHDAAIKVVREAYYPLIGETKKITGSGIRARDALLAVKTRWGAKVRQAQQVEADRLRAEANAAAKQAMDAARSASGNLEATERAEDLIRDAKAALGVATRAEKATPGKGYRTTVVVTMTDAVLAVRTMWKRDPEQFWALALRLAEVAARDHAVRTLDGFTIAETKVAV